MKRQLAQINSRVTTERHYLTNIPKEKLEYYIKDQLLKETVKVMLDELKTLPIEINTETDIVTGAEIHKMRFIIISESRLKQLLSYESDGE
jgi:hypothetical protein